MAMNLTSDNFEATIGTGVSLVDFWADWCGPCKMLGPIMNELATKYEGKASICKVNVDDEEGLAVRFGVMTIPTVILFRDGEELDKRIGVHPIEAFEELLRKAL